MGGSLSLMAEDDLVRRRAVEDVLQQIVSRALVAQPPPPPPPPPPLPQSPVYVTEWKDVRDCFSCCAWGCNSACYLVVLIGCFAMAYSVVIFVLTQADYFLSHVADKPRR